MKIVRFTSTAHGGSQFVKRVYDIKLNGEGATDAPAVASNKLQHVEMVAQLAGERAKTAMLEARFADAQDQITDLRRRLDQESEERRRL